MYHFFKKRLLLFLWPILFLSCTSDGEQPWLYNYAHHQEANVFSVTGTREGCSPLWQDKPEFTLILLPGSSEASISTGRKRLFSHGESKEEYFSLEMDGAEAITIQGDSFAQGWDSVEIMLSFDPTEYIDEILNTRELIFRTEYGVFLFQVEALGSHPSMDYL